MSKRTDPHRPGIIVPAHYRYVMSYSLPTSSGGCPIPGFRHNCERDLAEYETGKAPKMGEHAPGGMCCVKALTTILNVKFTDLGCAGKCSICGARYIEGDVWFHEPTGEHIHLGHNCAEKYEMLADRSAYELAHNRFRAAQAVNVLKVKKEKWRETFLAKHAGLAEAIEGDHYIIKDIKRRFTSACTISDKQVALVMKLFGEINKPKPNYDQEKHVEAPVGKRVEFAGKIVSRKVVENDFGATVKITIKVETPEGTWLTYGTAPGDLQEAVYKSGREWRGVAVKLRATLQAGDKDKHFCFMKRPTMLAAI